MPPRTDLALFLDCEMTGNGLLDEIIEIGCSLRETESWSEVDFFTSLVQPSAEAWDRLLDNTVVSDMHTKNGLIDDLDNAAVMGIGYLSAPHIDELVEEWLDTHLKGNKTHIPIGGSGVSHFDRPYLRREFPKLDARCTFWAYDSGNHRRSFRLAGRPWVLNSTNAQKTHRALDDARQHAEEWRYALTALRTGFDPEVMSQFETTMDY